ncbi:MAG: flagellar type III secretion system protein FlhB [Burkholderiales bacterium]|nr:flagellar type III secretion system protein FlhB [Burkholderiales bacterium]
MAEDSDLERTEPASQRRLEQARARGQVPRSPELTTFTVLITAGAGLLFLGGPLMHALTQIMRAGLTLDRGGAFDTSQLGVRLFIATADALIGLAPWFVLVAVAAIAASMSVSGWLFSFEALQPDFARLSPMRGLKRIFSLHGLIELGKAVLKAVLIGGVAAWIVWDQRAEIVALANEALQPSLVHLARILGYTFLMVAGALLLVVLVDVPFQLWDHARQLRMTKEEVRQEAKETEGDPQIKARIRSLQREAARRRMMAEVPKADVVVTNPDHYAVALRYAQGRSGAPRVVAKGSMLVAERIMELARGSGVPVLRAPPLARALFVHADLGQEIPSSLYNAVAEVLAWVYQLRRFRSVGGEAPREPSVHVPPGMDPDEGLAGTPA